jgi:ABC-type nitrate/sulfonate/bicarbonate transport system permease component
MSSRVPAKDYPTWRVDKRQAAVHSMALAISCVLSYWLVTELLAQVYFLSRADDLLGGLWAVIATAFVYRESYNSSRPAALSRMAATSLSFVLCLAYLLVLPYRRHRH